MVTSIGEKFIEERVKERLEHSLLQWKDWKKVGECTCNSLPTVEKEIGSGLVNHTFLVRSGSYRAVIRVNCANPGKLGIDRLRELKILEALKNSDFVPDILYRDSHVLVTEYISGYTLNDEFLGSPVNRSRLASVLERIQTTFVTGLNPFSYLDCCKGYARDLPYDPSEFVDWEQLCAVAMEIDRARHAPVLCHHDLVAENILIRQDAIFFIDWEFAAMGHPAYDYVKLFGEDISRGMLAQRDISSGDIKQINFLQSGIDRLWYSAKKIMRRQAKSGV